jgi:hypothetical protein
MTTRQEIENDVRACNSVLNDMVAGMSLIELLCNCHPMNRAEYAYRLYKEKELTKVEASQFVKIL